MAEPGMDEIADGFALWEEHKPQSGEDWLAVAERFIAAGESTENSTPLFAALVLAVEREKDARNRWEQEVRERLEQAAVNHEFNTDKAEGIRLALRLLKDPGADPHG